MYDACVLYPAPLRDLLIRLAQTGLFRARWTERIHDEWLGNLRKNRPELSADALARTRRLVDESVADALVSNYEAIEPTLQLPDPKDRHVLAAAVRCNASVIVTYNLKDFPAALLAPFGIDAQHPDEFIAHQFDLAPGAVAAAVRDQRASLAKPPRSVDELLDTFLSLQLAETVALLRTMQELL
jgi:predicted nucleic acid-binding protein